MFGYIYYLCMDSEDDSKIGPKSRKGSIIGYVIGKFGYKIYDHEEKWAYIVCDVEFDEDVLYGG